MRPGKVLRERLWGAKDGDDDDEDTDLLKKFSLKPCPPNKLSGALLAH